MYQYPLSLRFKLISLSPQIYLTDAQSKELLFIKQKLFKLKEDIQVFSDSAKNTEVFRIKADRIIDFSATYNFTDAKSGASLGSIKRRGIKSLWRATYFLSDSRGQETHKISESNPFVKLLDGIVGQIPILGMLTGYFLHPSYIVYRSTGETQVLRLTKQGAFFESVFKIEKLQNLNEEEERRVLLGLLMLVQLERRRG